MAEACKPLRLALGSCGIERVPCLPLLFPYIVVLTSLPLAPFPPSFPQFRFSLSSMLQIHSVVLVGPLLPTLCFPEISLGPAGLGKMSLAM
jgi:hypothetical protein